MWASPIFFLPFLWSKFSFTNFEITLGMGDHLIAKCPYDIKDNKYKKDKKEEKADHRKSKKYMEEAHIGHE